MFVVTKSPTLWVKVEGTETTESGRRVDFGFEIRIKRITYPQLQQMYKDAAEQGLSDFEALKEVIIDWRGIGDETGEAKAFSAEALEDLMAQIGGGPFVRAVNGAMPKAKEKN